MGYLYGIRLYLHLIVYLVIQLIGGFSLRTELCCECEWKGKVKYAVSIRLKIR